MSKNVNITTFPSLLDLIAPHSCLGCGTLGTILCDRCKKYLIRTHRNICPRCKAQKYSHLCDQCPELPPTYTLGMRHELLDLLVHELKYSSNRSIATALAELLARTLPRDLPTSTTIVPLPTSTRHIRERGLDHTLLIAKRLARLRGWTVTRALERARNTTQVGSARRDRLAQADAAYVISNTFRPDASTTYLLLDDVWTTGATMLSALNKLKNAGATDVRISIIALSELS